MSKYLNVLIGIAMVFESAYPLMAAGNLAATLSPIRESFIAGEPIDLVLKFHNTTGATVSVEGGRPFFAGRTVDGGLKLVSHPEIKSKRASILRDPRFIGHGAAISTPSSLIGVMFEGIGATPGETSSTTLFAQEFFGDPQPGTYDLNYTVDISTKSGAAAGPRIQGHGGFRITVSPGSEGELSQALARRVDAQSSHDVRISEAATEGLLIVNSPVVVPYLIRMGPRPQPYDVIVMAMEKFKGNRQATDFVLGKLRTGDTAEVVPALYVLTEWGFALPQREVLQLLRHGSFDARLAAIRYVDGLPGRPYNEEIKALTMDVDGEVAGVAKRVLKASGAK